jgi:EmrB/QacA subfamily drug resistance transporter
MLGDMPDHASPDGATALPAAEIAAAPVRSYRVTALIVASAMFMEQVDSTVLSTAIPAMAHSFGADPVQMNVALTAYLLSLAVFIPASGKFADRFGSRTVFRAAIALFTIGSVLCGRANGLPFLVAARILQGIGGAMMVPVGRLVLLRTTAKADLVSAMAWLLVPATLGPMVGPPLGGFLVTYLSWRWIFDINVPIGVLGIVLATLFIDEIKEPDAGPLDGVGMVLSGIALSCLMFGLELAAHGEGSMPLAAALIVAGLVAAALYWPHARRQRSPVLDLRLMRVPTFGISVVSGSLFRVAIGAVPFLLPLMLQIGFGMSAAASGAITFASSGGSLLMRACAKPILHRFGFRRVLVVNGAVSMALLAAFAFFRPDWPRPVIYAVLLTTGFFHSLQFTAYNTIAYADLPPARMSAGTSFYSTFQQLSLSLGITVSAAVLAASTALSGHAQPTLPDFSATFLVIAAIGLLAAPAGLRLGADAGEELSGHREPAKAG